MHIHQLIVKSCYSMECLRIVWSCMKRSFYLKQILSCRFCQNSFCNFHQPQCAPEEQNCCVDGRGESGWTSGTACCWRSWQNWWRCVDGADIEGEGVDVVCGALALAISGLEFQGFNFSEVVHRNRLEGQTLSEGVVNTARPPQCEFSNLHSSLAFGLLE